MLADDPRRFERQLDVLKPQLVLLYEDNLQLPEQDVPRRACARAACEMLALARARGARAHRRRLRRLRCAGKYLAAGAHAVLHGEALATLVALIDRLDRNRRARLARTMGRGPARMSASPARTAPLRATRRAHCRNRSLAALPAWDLVDIEKYRARLAARAWLLQPQHGRLARLFVPLQLVREAHLGQSIPAAPGRARWPRRLIHLRRHYRPDHIWFADDIFGFKVDWVNEFAAALAERRRRRAVHHPAARAISSARAWPKRCALRAAAKPGSAPSGSQKILDAMNKGTRVRENIARASPAGRRRASAWASSCSSVISARSSTTSSPRAGWSRRRGPTTSA